MSDEEVKDLWEQMNCMERNLLQAIADLRVHLAEGYVSKEELRDFKSDQKWIVGIAASIGGIIVATFWSVINYFKRGGN